MITQGWVEANNRHLAASLHWLRLRLLRLAPDDPAPARAAAAPSFAPPVPAAAPSVSLVPVARGGRLWRRRLEADAVLAPSVVHAPEPPPAQVITLPEAALPTIEEQLEQATADRQEAAAVEPPPALSLLAQRLELSPFERDTLLLCAAMELDPGMASLCGRAQGHGRNYATFALALSAFEAPSWDALLPQRPLRYSQLVEINQTGAVPVSLSPLRADERIVSFLKGWNMLDERLAALLTPVTGNARLALAGSQHEIVEAVRGRLRQAAAQSVLPVVQLVGTDTGSKLAVASEVCATLGRQLHRIGFEALPSPVDEIETLVRLWQRESLLLPVALYVDAESAAGDAAAPLRRFLSREVGMVFLGVRETPLGLGGATFALDVEKPTAVEQRAAWATVLGTEEPQAELDRVAQLLAGQFDLNLDDVEQAASVAFAGADGKPARDTLWQACRDLTRPRLDSLAQRLAPKATWDDLVLPEEPLSLLHHIAGQVRERHKVYDDWGFAQRMNRGFGISALFTGESGTGKSMAAEVIANDLNLNLYRIDLSAVVSKYIGETEKNLARLFDAAEQGGAILFFDEADALFGKRSEVKDSHDRYANIEINYLLQRMEAFSGLAILATNMKSALDSAFMRRLRFIVNFQFPGIEERTRIWQKALPPETPTRALEYDRLARLSVTGGNIHSIALNAAFGAAQAGGPVDMAILLAAARRELRKLDKPFNEAEFR